MKVHSHALEAYSRVALTPGSASRIAPSPSGASTPVSSEAAQINVSPEARNLAVQSSSVDEKKVAELKAKIDNGTYVVNAQILAARLLDTLG